MSNLNELKRFENDLQGSEELRNRLNEVGNRIKDAGQAANDSEILVAAAQELGYDVSVAALEQAKAEAEALDPESLADVAGGVDNSDKKMCMANLNYLCTINYHSTKEDENSHDAWCLTGWHCYAVTLHSETADTDVKCWKDYSCFIINK